MSVQWEIKKGNTSIQDFLVTDKNDATVTTLSTATSIKFQIKKTKTATTALVEKTAIAGIQVNTPTTGYLRITLTPTDTGTTLSVGDYFMGLRITESGGSIYETNLSIDDIKTEKLRIRQNIVT